MDKNVPDLVEQLHREAVQHHRQQKDNGRASLRPRSGSHRNSMGRR